MATSFLTSADLITSLKRRASIPESQVTFEEQDFLDILNEEMSIGLVPSVLLVHEEYFVTQVDVPLVDGKLSYAIPYRAIGNRVRELSYVDSSGNVYPMTRVNPEDIYRGANFGLSTSIARFTIEGGNIVLLNHPNSQFTGSLRFKYYLRPNILVSSKRAGQISNINTTTGVITFNSALPKNFSASMLIDFTRQKSDHRIISFDVQVTAIGSNSVTVDPLSIPSDLEIGDYVCSAGETVIPNIPTELHVVLAQRGAARCVEALGDSQGLQNANIKLAEMEAKTQTLIDNRTEGNPQKVINRNSFIRRGLSGFLRRRY